MDQKLPIKTLDTYLSLCTEVYELSKPHAPRDAYLFYRAYAEAAKGAILEPMCGTGRFLLPLLEEGFNVHGFDASPSMLAKLHEKAKAKQLKPTIWHGFAETLNRPEKYDLIFIPSSSFCLIADEEVVKRVLDAYYKQLTHTGTLLFEIETMQAVPKLGKWPGSMWPQTDGSTIVLSGVTTFDGEVCTALGKYEWVRDRQIIHTEVETYTMKIYQQELLIDLLKTTGFNQIRILKAFDVSQQPNEPDETVVFECRK